MTALTELTPAEARARVQSGEAVLIDVRESFEHRDEHIPGAHLIALSAFDAQEVARLAGDRTPIFQCRSGKRSADAASRYAPDGAPTVHLAGGILAWKEAGLDTERAASAPKLDVMRQVQMTAGGLVVVGVALGAFVHPGFLGISAFVGCGLVFAGASGWCGMAELLARMPWNR